MGSLGREDGQVQLYLYNPTHVVLWELLFLHFGMRFIEQSLVVVGYGKITGVLEGCSSAYGVEISFSFWILSPTLSACPMGGVS
jgi:hypothetical protein